MGALFRADNPVTDSLSEDEEFNNAVDPDNSNDETIYASNLSEQGYLDIGSKSLDELTAKGTITRGELVYMLVQNYFVDEYSNVDVKGECYSDVKNGGDIAAKQKFIDKDSQKDHWKSYELTYALQNPDKGCPESMYKALIVAKSKGIITGEESRWDEGVTKSDFLEMLVNSYLALTPQVSADQGEGEDIALEPTMVDGVEVWPDFPEKYVKFETLNPEKTMYCIDACTKYFNPNMKNGELVSYATLSTTGDQLTFNATCEIDGEKYYRFTQEDTNLSLIVPADCWSETPPAEDTASELSSEEELRAWAEEQGLGYIEPYDDPGDWSDIPQEIVEQAGRLQYE